MLPTVIPVDRCKHQSSRFPLPRSVLRQTSETQQAQRLDVIHDQLQNEKTRITAKGAALNEQVLQGLLGTITRVHLEPVGEGAPRRSLGEIMGSERVFARRSAVKGLTCSSMVLESLC